MSNETFADRINTACDGNPNIPPYGHGRQTYIKEKMGVSHEAVRKWFLGESRPRPDKFAELARVLECDEAWLALGKKGDLDPREKRARSANIDGAVNIVTGMLQLNGASCAFPAEKDPQSGYVDVYAINRGVQMAIHVALAKDEGNNEFTFTLPKEYLHCRIVGVVPVKTSRVHMLSLEEHLIAEHAHRKGGFVVLPVSHTGGDYWCGEDKVKKIENFSRDL
jgi:transcriptional regulator with XRE-family HTH domain